MTEKTYCGGTDPFKTTYKQRVVNDAVDHPYHYKQGGIEYIDAIEASMTKEDFAGYLKGNIIKYSWRYKMKNGVEDLKKAERYLKKLIVVES